MSSTLIAKSIDFDAGHRVARHESQCANPHGHRYTVTLTVEGAVHDDDTPEHGMVVDFGRLKAFLTERVHDRFDHGFIVERSDANMRAAMTMGTGWKMILVDDTPTAENLAKLIGLDAVAYFADDSFTVYCVQVNETPSSAAEWYP